MSKNQLSGLMKQAQQLQANMEKMQATLAMTEVEGESGGGLVKIVMTCNYEIKKIVIDPSLLTDDKDMLEDLIVAAFNGVLKKARDTSGEKMKSVAGDMLPAGLGLPF